MPRGLKNELNPKWKGDHVSYNGLHKWLTRHKGKPIFCCECGKDDDRRYEWANISQRYERRLDDYRSLCVSCHRKEAFKLGATVWNKGTKGICKSNSGSFISGQPSPNRGRTLKPDSKNYHTLYMRKYRQKLFVEIKET